MYNREDMVSFKNNNLKILNNEQLCKLHNDKEVSNRKTRLYVSKSYNFAKTYHPLKQKKIKLHKLRFIPSISYTVINNKNFSVKNNCNIKILPKKYSVNSIKYSGKQSVWYTKDDVIEWLLSINVKISKKSSYEYFLKDRLCFFNNVLVFANKKRTEMGLEPFYLDNFAEF